MEKGRKWFVTTQVNWIITGDWIFFSSTKNYLKNRVKVGSVIIVVDDVEEDYKTKKDWKRKACIK